jgi:hypothetical protein
MVILLVSASHRAIFHVFNARFSHLIDQIC